MSFIEPFHVILLALFITYLAICVSTDKGKTYFFGLSALFLFFAIYLRIEVPPELSKDFIAYFKFSGYDSFRVSLTSLFIEPYRYVLYAVVSQFFDSQIEIVTAVYYFNLLAISVLFLWIAQLPDVATWKKVGLFCIYYVVFSLVWIRAGMAYAIMAYFLYHGFRNRMRFVGFAAPLVHFSSAPILYLWLLRYVKTYLKPFFLIALAGVAAFFLSSSYSVYLLGKVDIYIETGDAKDNIKHQLYFLVISVFFFASYFVNKKNMKGEFFIFLYAFYAVVHLTNVVAGQRISHFLIFALLLLPGSRKMFITLPKWFVVFPLAAFLVILYVRFYTVINVDFT